MISYSRPLVILIFLVPTFISYYLLIKKSFRFKKEFLLTLVCFFALFYGLRNFGIGVDTNEYLSRYVSMSGNKDPLFSFLTNSLHILLFGNKQLYLVSLALLNNTVLAYALYRLFDKNYTKTIFAYLLTIMLPYVILANVNIMRQGLSMSFILLALSYITKNKLLCIVYALTSIGLHKMMIFFWLILLAICFIKKYLKSIKYSYFFIFSLVLCILLKMPFVINILKLFENNFYITKLLLHINTVSFSAVLKTIFYFGNYLVLIHLFKKQGKTYNLFNAVYLTLLIASSLFSFSELYSMRFLIALEYIIPYLYLSILPRKLTFRSIELNPYFIYISFSYIYLFLSLYLNALSTDLGL